MNPAHTGSSESGCGSWRGSGVCEWDGRYHRVMAIRHHNHLHTVQPITTMRALTGKGSPYSITERRVLELIPVLDSQPAGDVSHKHGGRLPLLSARPAVTLTTLKTAATNFAAWWTEAQWVWTVCLRLLPDCDLNPGPSATESSTLTTWALPAIKPNATATEIIARWPGIGRWKVTLTFDGRVLHTEI